MELSENIEDYINVYVNEILKSSNKKVARCKLKKAYAEKGEEDNSVAKFMLWYKGQKEAERLRTLITAQRLIIKRLEDGADPKELIEEYKSDLVMANHRVAQHKAQNERLTRNNIKLQKQMKKDAVDRGSVSRAARKEKTIDEKLSVLNDLRAKNDELKPLGIENDRLKAENKKLREALNTRDNMYDDNGELF